MDSAPDHLRRLRDLESRHEEVLRKLDELEKRIVRVLAEQSANDKARIELARDAGGPPRPMGMQ